MSRAKVGEPESEKMKLDRLQSSIADLNRDIANREAIGEKLRRDFDEKLQTASPEKLIPLKQKSEINQAQLDQLKGKAREQELRLITAVEESSIRTERAIMRFDFERAEKDFDAANAEYMRLRQEYSALPEKIQKAFFAQSEALRIRIKTQAALQSVGDS